MTWSSTRSRSRLTLQKQLRLLQMMREAAVETNVRGFVLRWTLDMLWFWCWKRKVCKSLLKSHQKTIGPYWNELHVQWEFIELGIFTLRSGIWTAPSLAVTRHQTSTVAGGQLQWWHPWSWFFHSHEGTPIAGWFSFLRENPIQN